MGSGGGENQLPFGCAGMGSDRGIGPQERAQGTVSSEALWRKQNKKKMESEQWLEPGSPTWTQWDRTPGVRHENNPRGSGRLRLGCDLVGLGLSHALV